MKEYIQVTIWLHSGAPLYFEEAWNYKEDEGAIRFRYKDQAGRTMSADFDVAAIAGVAIEG